MLQKNADVYCIKNGGPKSLVVVLFSILKQQQLQVLNWDLRGKKIKIKVFLNANNRESLIN
jgi:hypothetical protein